MKKQLNIIVSLLLIFSSFGICQAADEQPLFPLPTPPDEMVVLRERCNYIVDRYWERCNFDQAMKHPKKFKEAFESWVDLMPYAGADTVHMAIDRLLTRFKKSGPETLELAKMAESYLWADTAALRSEEVYLPFAKAAADNKKISKAERARFAAQTKVIESSKTGAPLPPLTLTAADGTKTSLSDITGDRILVFINDPDCSDCALARVRLSADYNTKQLIDKGGLTIVSIYPGPASDETWRNALDSYPDNWLVYAAEDADELFDLRNPPTLIYVDKGKIAVKNVVVDNLLTAFQLFNNK